MLFFALSGLLIGLLLGGLTVAALLPATIFVLVVASGTYAIGGEAFGPGMIETGALIAGLQFGYLAGATMRFFLLEPAIRTAKSLWSARAGANSVNSPLRD